MSARLLCAVGALGSLMCWSAAAAAWCRTTTCDPTDQNETCEFRGKCNVSGSALYWPSLCVSFAVQKDGTHLRDIPANVVSEVVSDGYLTWLAADCGGGEHPSLRIVTQGEAICNQQTYNQDGPNANVWMFRDDKWPYVSVAGHTLALTTVTFNVDNGEIFDVDVEINSVQNELSLDDTDVKNDLASIVTHEAGHFLGLSHSEITSATMFETYKAGSIELRTLDPDDMAGICAAYPPNRQPRTDSCSPRRGFVSECEDPPPESCACATPGKNTQSGGAALAFLLLASLVTRRRHPGRPLSAG
jgi:MYXO-CTERM domain-containing protein